MPLQAVLDDELIKTHGYVSLQDSAKAIDSARLTKIILDEIVSFIRPGQRESDVAAYATTRFEAHGVIRLWHTTYIRFGEHTLMTYQNKAKDDRVLGENDIAFVDIGIVKDGIEGDAGKTIAFGSNKVLHKLAHTSEEIFHEIVAYWKTNNPTGQELYTYTHTIAEKHEVLFNLDPAGHLIGAFPHRGWMRGLNNFPEKVEAGTWILEIQIKHRELPYGAFYEDLLY